MIMDGNQSTTQFSETASGMAAPLSMVFASRKSPEWPSSVRRINDFRMEESSNSRTAIKTGADCQLSFSDVDVFARSALDSSTSYGQSQRRLDTSLVAPKRPFLPFLEEFEGVNYSPALEGYNGQRARGASLSGHSRGRCRRLQPVDEHGRGDTHVRLKEHLRVLIDPKIAEYRGRVVKNTGDGMLAEFSSVVDAERCAVKIQRGMAERNANVPEEKRIEFRIGVNFRAPDIG
jgi:hypothetical protein